MGAVRPQLARLAPGSVRTRTVAWMRRETRGRAEHWVVSPAVVVGQTVHAGQPGTSGQPESRKPRRDITCLFRFHWWAHGCRTRSVSGGDRCRSHRSAGGTASAAASGWAMAEGLRSAVTGTGRSGRGGRTRPGGGQSKLAATIASNSACNPWIGADQLGELARRGGARDVRHRRSLPARPCVRHQVMYHYRYFSSPHLRLCQPSGEVIWRHHHNTSLGSERSVLADLGNSTTPTIPRSPPDGLPGGERTAASSVCTTNSSTHRTRPPTCADNSTTTTPTPTLTTCQSLTTVTTYGR